MKVHLQPGKTEMPIETEQAILERIHFALARFDHRIHALQVRLDDLNGPNGGVDKRCVMEAVLMPRGRLVVEIVDADVLGAVTRALRRLVRRVEDEFERMRDLC